MLQLLLPLADVGGAFTGITGMFVSYLGPILGFALVVLGYQYMFALDDHTKATQTKRAIGMAIVGAMLVALGAGIALAAVSKMGS